MGRQPLRRFPVEPAIVVPRLEGLRGLCIAVNGKPLEEVLEGGAVARDGIAEGGGGDGERAVVAHGDADGRQRRGGGGGDGSTDGDGFSRPHS